MPVGFLTAEPQRITDPTCPRRSGVGETHWDHVNEIKAAYGRRHATVPGAGIACSPRGTG